MFFNKARLLPLVSFIKLSFSWVEHIVHVIIDIVMSVKSSRIAREGKTVEVMISLYCRHHHQSNELCDECVELTNYALERLHKCPFREGKTICAKCPMHCYQPLMREKIRADMRYARHRMTHRYPIMTFFHFIDRMRKAPINPRSKATG